MPKSKEFIDSSDSDEPKNSNKNQSDSDEETFKPSKSKKTKSKDNNPPAKRSKPNNDDDDEVASTIGPNGERLYEIGKLRFVSVSQFKGKPYINIREYYEDNGVQKPGKKGISLAADQWEKLKTLVNQVDKDLKKSK